MGKRAVAVARGGSTRRVTTRSWWSRHSIALVGVIVLASGLLACSAAQEQDAAESALDDDAITIASFDFAESELLGEIYARAIAARGYEVRHARRIGPRELVLPALAAGLVELVPEYAGTSLEFLSRGSSVPSSDELVTHRTLVRVLQHTSVVALGPAPAQSANAVVVRRETARQLDLERISDLEALAPRLTFGGPPECPGRPFCLEGLERVYGLAFQTFIPLDAGGPLTRQSLDSHHVDAAILFTTDPSVATTRLVVLEDDRRLQPAENVTPLVHEDVVRRWGDRLSQVIDGVSARLTTEGLRALNARVASGETTQSVAAAWLQGQGLR